MRLAVVVQLTALLAANVMVCAVADARAIVELAVTFNVDELAHVRVAVIPVVPSVPPLSTTCEANVALADGLRRSSPPVTVVLPV